jgi:hypothetical protein
MLIGAGGERDRASIKLATRCGTFIPNERRRERPPDALRAAKEMWTEKYPNIRVRSLSAVYNCVGLVFGSRRTCIDPDQLELILREDGYRRLPGEHEVEVGDLVLYRVGNKYEHIAVVVHKKQNFINACFEITVISQWGSEGEYIHLIRDVPPALGTPQEFWTDRRLL